jgi:hypothetical protein
MESIPFQFDALGFAKENHFSSELQPQMALPFGIKDLVP